jgi:ANTAR domain
MSGNTGSMSSGADDNLVVRKGERGWVVGQEEVSDLTSAMVLADLFAAEEGNPADNAVTRPARVPEEANAAERLAVTVQQLEHALASRVRVEQAIGVLAERRRLRPREAFDLLRGAARSRGVRLTEVADDVVDSAANPLLRLPEELAREVPQQAHPRVRGSRRASRRAAKESQQGC